MKEWGLNVDTEHKVAVESVLSTTQLTPDIAEQVQKLWKTKFVQDAFERNNELQLPGGSSGAEYFFKAADRFASEDYLPTQEDVIRAKVRTTGTSQAPADSPADGGRHHGDRLHRAADRVHHGRRRWAAQ